MNKLFKIFLLLINVVFYFSAYAEIQPKCQKEAQKFIKKGDLKQSSGRVWNFELLTSKETPHNECLKEIFNQAHSEAKSYWDKIKEKNNCPNKAKSQCENATINLTYLESQKLIFNEHHDEHCDQKESFTQHITPIMTALPLIEEDKTCDFVPAEKRKKMEGVLKIGYESVKGCLKNFVVKFLTNIRDVFTSLWELTKFGAQLAVKFGEGIVDFLKAAWYGTMTTFLAEMYSDGSDMMDNFISGLKELPSMIENYAEKEYTEFQCLNGVGRTEYVCGAIGYLAPDALLLFFTMGSSSTVQATTIGTKIKQALKPIDKLVDLSKAKTARTTAKAASSTSAIRTLSHADAIKLVDALPPSQATIMKEAGLLPKTTFKVANGQISISDIYTSSGGRAFAQLIIELEDGTKVTRTVYRSNSQGVWRISDGVMGQWISKGPGESFMSLDPKIQRYLQSQKPKGEIEFGQIVRIDTENKDFLELASNAKSYPRVNAVEDMNPKIPRNSSKSTLSRPENIVINNPELKPNFRVPNSRYEIDHPIHGKVEVLTYNSKNKAIEYTIMKGKDGKIWIADAIPKNRPINKFGIPEEGVDFGDLLTPRWEYPEQIAKEFSKEIDIRNGRYASNWEYVKRIPEIQEWYKVNNLPIPD